MTPQQITSYIIQNIHEIPISVLNVLVQQLSEAEKTKVKEAINALEQKEVEERNLWNVKYDYTQFEPKNEESPKNETIETLLRWFNNPKSKKIQLARMELHKRFPFQSYLQQRKIMDAVMQRGSKIDVLWAAKHLLQKVYWKDEYLDTILSVWKTEKTNWKLAKIISVHASKECVRECVTFYNPQKPKDKYPNDYAYDLLITRAALDDSQFVIDKNTLTPMQYVFTCAKVNRKISHNDAIGGFYSCIAISFNKFGWRCLDFDFNIREIKTIKYFFYCLSDLGMLQEIVQCNDWIMNVSKTIRSKMVDQYGENILQKHRLNEEQEKYKIYLHQNVIPQLFPNDYKGFLAVNYSDYSYEKWLEKGNHMEIDENEELRERTLEIEAEGLDNSQSDEIDDIFVSIHPEAPF